MSPSESQQIGSLTADVANIKAQLEKQDKTLTEVRDMIVSAKGGWWTLMAVGGIAGSIGAFLARFWPGN